MEHLLLLKQIVNVKNHAHRIKQALQDVDLDHGLVVEAALVTDDLECHLALVLVVKHLHDLPKAALP